MPDYQLPYEGMLIDVRSREVGNALWAAEFRLDEGPWLEVTTRTDREQAAATYALIKARRAVEKLRRE